MLREEQIDIRRQRARASKLAFENLGKNRVFSDWRVTNPASGGQYTVTVRGFEVGDNVCTCPDFKANTLGTCKHIEALLEHLAAEAPPHVRQRKAAVVRPEIYLHYGEQLRLGLHLPPRHSDQLGRLAREFFGGAELLWTAGDRFDDLIRAVESVPEQVTIFSDALDFVDRETDRRDLARREAELVACVGASPGPLDGILKVPLYDYQQHGAVFAACRGRCILGDDMGLGKTVQAMAAAELLARERHIERVLVVAPASVKYQWETEVRKFTDRPVQVIEGGPRARGRQYARPTFYRLVNYEQVLKDLAEINAWKPDLIVLDEAQRIKNWESKVSRAVKKLQSRYALVLTGTPLENKLEELYSIVQFVDDRRLGPAFQFLHEHRVLDEQGRLLGYRNLDTIRERLAPILLRRTRGEVLSQLPPRTDNTVFVEMSDAQRTPYEEQRAGLARLLSRKFHTDLDRKRILSLIANLRMLCNSTWLFDKTTNVSPKLEEFGELVQELVAAGGHKAVVFSQWEAMLQKAAEVLDRLGVGHAVLHGAIPARDRQAVLDRFRHEAGCRVLLSTDAGGTGLNLQTADTVINLEVPWNPAVLDQRIARVHRMGQERPVRVINLVTRGGIEERVLRAIQAKRSLFAGVFDGEGDEVTFAALGQAGFLEEVRELAGVEPAVADVPEPAPAASMPAPDDAHRRLLEAGVQFLEALAETLPSDGPAGVPADLRRRGAAALARILRQFTGPDGNAGGP